MASTVQFANAEQLAYFLQLYQQYYAAAQTGATPVDIAVGLQFVETGGQLVAGQIGSAQISGLLSAGTNYPATTAGQAFSQYVAAGGTTSTAIAATSTAANEVVANGAIATSSSGAGVVGLLSMNLPTVAAAIAPVAGVALGAGLYGANPDFWEKISRALLPFCYEDTELMPVVVDENGTTYYPQEAIDAVKSVIGEISNGEVSSPEPIEGIEVWNTPLRYTMSTVNKITFSNDPDAYFYMIANKPVKMYAYLAPTSTGRYAYGIGAVSLEPFRYVVKYFYGGDSPDENFAPDTDADSIEYNGKVYYTAGLGTSNKENHLGSATSPVNTATGFAAKMYYAIDYAIAYEGEIVPPEGVSLWSGVEYPANPEGVDVVTKIENGEVTQTKPYVPITTPGGVPGASVPSTTPDLQKNETIIVIDPWIVPNPSKDDYPDEVPVSPPAPLKDPVPNLEPDLDPSEDPSKPPVKAPPTTTTTDPPVNGGSAPTPAIPVIPVLPSAATGLLHVYNPTQSQIDAFGSWLWATFSGDLIETLSKLFNDPMDAVIGLHELYATPAVSGSATIRAGYLDSGISSNLVGSRYTTINCGSIVVQEYYQNYLDYSPYTKCYIYLPFIGIVPVLADDIIGNAVNITYHVDSYTGCCIAVVTVARSGYSSTVYQFEGNCAVEIPITSGYQSTLVGALIGVGATALTGNPHAGIAAANMGRASLGKNDVSHSGSFGSSYGAMGAKVPYIIVKRPTQKSVVNYNQDYGFPAHKRVTIGACSGYLRAREVHVISPTATDEEKARIEEMLKEGVFVK